MKTWVRQYLLAGFYPFFLICFVCKVYHRPQNNLTLCVTHFLGRASCVFQTIRSPCYHLRWSPSPPSTEGGAWRTPKVVPSPHHQRWWPSVIARVTTKSGAEGEGIKSFEKAFAIATTFGGRRRLVFFFNLLKGASFMAAYYLPSILVPLVGLVFPALTMASLFLYIEKDDVS